MLYTHGVTSSSLVPPTIEARVMNQIRAIYASAIQQWKQITISGGNLSFHLATLPMESV
jgi:hypothetical protein